ncbi:RagB/SusD family nutrient uptake outer membrane protein [Fulvivirga maritima]|uniref:RagB/SusD family nutrient uptake outer membrane protein n=1 Tax=Fulvivirga maritima TaxID=2904247 RepID=UPI001F33DCCD|nr:RagB/SusD family nutrient uptake outer membrane protein [Fulvivirga maritima]UII24877.1 RagB/SusD family nutrient uptake outer membrane protein [Fulvivirga maritima]
MNKLYTHRIVWLFSVLMLLLHGACNDDFLEKPESNDVTRDEIFSERIKALPFLWETYRTCVPLGFPYQWDRHNGMYASMMVGACDEGDVTASWTGSNNHNVGNVTPGYNGEDEFNQHFKGIRNANIFIENVDQVPDIPDGEKQELKAEARVLRALQVFDLMIRYGGVPIVTTVLSGDGDMYLPRDSYADCVQFIVDECDAASAILPNDYPSNYTGRVTKGVALALKARTLLYAASPLYNTATPYLSENRALTGYESYDEGRWKLAADANEAVLNWADQQGYHLIEEYDDPAENYKEAIETPQNAEIIFANQMNGWWSTGYLFFQAVMPTGIYTGWYGHGITLEHASKYYTTDGEDQSWPDSGPQSEFLEKMHAMEPRFQYSVMYSGSAFNDNIGVVNFYRRNDGSWSTNAPVNGVGYMKKFITKASSSGGQFNWTVFRLAEFYLNYAEALNESSPMDSRVFDAVNAIRRRAGIPEISSADPRYNSQDKLREAIRRERAIELAFEEHRFFDVRRWMIADQEGVMRGDFHGLNLYEQEDGSFIYRKEAFEERVWQNKLYLYPFPQTEIDKGYIVQNPGW